ncbi:MAG: leucine-rich repeat domain-containing protein [Bacteroidia bacterium]
MKAIVLGLSLMFVVLSANAQCPPLKEALEKPKEVKVLDLTGCGLRVFPKDILKLKNLKALHMGPSRLIMYRKDAGSPIKGNLFKLLPENFGKLSQLEVLNLQATDLRNLPSSLEKLENLQQLDLSFNPRLDSVVLFDLLPKLPRLSMLNLTGCGLTPVSCRRLAAILPETECIFDRAVMIARD